MNNKSVDVKILESNPNFVKVALPFLDIPVCMNHEFFNKRIESGYFNVREKNEQLNAQA